MHFHIIMQTGRVGIRYTLWLLVLNILLRVTGKDILGEKNLPDQINYGNFKKEGK